MQFPPVKSVLNWFLLSLTWTGFFPTNENWIIYRFPFPEIKLQIKQEQGQIGERWRKDGGRFSCWGSWGVRDMRAYTLKMDIKGTYWCFCLMTSYCTVCHCGTMLANDVINKTHLFVNASLTQTKTKQKLETKQQTCWEKHKRGRRTHIQSINNYYYPDFFL